MPHATGGVWKRFRVQLGLVHSEEYGDVEVRRCVAALDDSRVYSTNSRKPMTAAIEHTLIRIVDATDDMRLHGRGGLPRKLK